MKFKEKIPIGILDGALAVKSKLRTPKINVSLYFQAGKRKRQGRSKRTSGTKKRTKKQNRQRLIFSHCDCIYRFLRKFSLILYKWKNKTAIGKWRKRKLRSYFMHRCLRFYIPDLLEDYLFLKIDYLIVEEKEDKVIVRTRVIPRKEVITEEDLFHPAEARLL